jgi:hypothetical protein
MLLEPSAGDVVFIVRDTDGSRRKLYAYKSILAENSEYFASRTPTLDCSYINRTSTRVDIYEIK